MNEIKNYVPKRNEVTVDNLLEFLKTKIPEFWKTINEEDIDEIHLIFGDFALWLVDLLNNSKNENIVSKSFNFLNYIIENGNDDVHNLIQVSVFHIFKNENEFETKIKHNLNRAALLLYNQYV